MGTQSSLTRLRRREALTAWLFSAPALILIFTFLILPFIMAFVFSFTNQRFIPNPNLPTKFVAFRNYVRLFEDPVFLEALGNNAYFSIVVVPVQTCLALFLAVLVNQKLKGVIIFRALYFMPVVVSMVVVSIIWTFIYNPTAGPINAFIQWISGGKLGPYTFIRSKTLALPAIMVLSVWQSVGMQMVIFLAGLQDIPQYLYDAAEVDGASRWQRFRHVTLPGLRNTTIFIVMALSILSFRLFTQVRVMTDGGPANATMTLVLYSVKQGWERLKIGYGSAISVVFFGIVLILSLIQRYLMHSEEVQKKSAFAAWRRRIRTRLAKTPLVAFPREMLESIGDGVSWCCESFEQALKRSMTYTTQKKVMAGISYLIMIGFAFFFLTPLLFMIMSAIKTDEFQVVKDMSTLRAFIPIGELGLQNFRDVYALVDFNRLVLNTAIIVTISVFGGLVVNSLIAYALARLRFRGRGLILGLLISLIIIPFEAVAVPLLLEVNTFPWFGGETGWLDTYRVQILPFMANALMIFLFYQFFLGFPKDLEEAAIVDGANFLQIFYKLVLPLSKPIFATVTIMTFIHRWNDFLWPLMVTRGIKVRPLMVGYQQFFGRDTMNWGDIMAFGAMATVPVLIVFLLLQRTFIQSIASSGIKG